MNREELKINHVYEAKKPKVANILTGYLNDRMILFIGINFVQYDSPTVKNGRTYPKIPIDTFMKWVGRDVTAETPEGTWRTH